MKVLKFVFDYILTMLMYKLQKYTSGFGNFNNLLY